MCVEINRNRAFKKKKIFKKKLGGFTLIEMSVMLVILSFAAVSMVVANQDVQKLGKVKSTEATIKKVNKALLKYAKKFGAFPCPSVPFLLMNDGALGFAANNPGDCDNAGTDEGIITSSDGSSYRGAVPIRTLGLKDEDMFDGWNRRLIYVVSKNVTLSTTYAEKSNLILLSDFSSGSSNSESWYSVNPTYTKRANVPFILMSAGENGFGSFKMTTSSQNIGDVIDPVSTSSSLPEALNYKLVNHVGSSLIDESVVNNMYVKPDDIVDNFDDIVFAGFRYPSSTDYPDFDPRTIDAGSTQRENAIRLVAWYNADDASSLTSNVAGCSDLVPIADGENVQCWRDISGNGNHLTLSGATAPTYVTGRIDTTSADSSGNVVNFTGAANENLKIANFSVDGTDIDMVPPFTIFTVVKNMDWSVEKYIYDNGVTTDESSLSSVNTGGGRYNSGLGFATVTGRIILTNSQNLFLVSSVINGSNSVNYTNGQKASNAVEMGVSTVMDGITVGTDRNGLNGMVGDVAEIIVLKGRVTDKVRRQIEKMLASRWTDEADGASIPTNDIDLVVE